MIQIATTDLAELLSEIKNKDYIKPCKNLSGSSIGQHARHAIEMFQCLLVGYENKLVNYNARKRDFELEQNLNKAIQTLSTTLKELNKKDIELTVESNGTSCTSSFNRELLYCNEHLIHHLALIKIGVKELGICTLNENFGVAPSTIQYKKECAQ